jgi:hypothetical protein
VRLSSVPNFYYNPEVGEPVPQTFIDEESLASNRLFGQRRARLQRFMSSLPTE